MELERESGQTDPESRITYVLLWDEFQPGLYELAVTLRTGRYTDTHRARFGMRKIAAEGTQFTVNGRKTFLRGTLECCIFPLTGYPPMNTEYWHRVFKTCKAHGLNHMRFHSHCPPEAAFEAADEEGFYLQVECGVWTTVGDGKPVDDFIRAEGDRIPRGGVREPPVLLLHGPRERARRKEQQDVPRGPGQPTGRRRIRGACIPAARTTP